MAVRRRVTSVCQWPPACAAIPRRWRVAALGVALLAEALAGGEASAQSGGCARCGAAPPALAPSAGPSASVERSWRKEARREIRSRHKLAMALAWSGGSYTVCVRACDGAFFPVTYFGAASRSDTLEQICRSQCPNADVALYSFPFGGTIDEAVSSAGEPYAVLPNAHKFEQSYDRSCSCRAPAQSWAEALAAAEAKYGRHSHDILVTVEDAERMSRPVHDPKAKPAATDSGEPGAAAPVELDINGVDTTLSAAAKTISRETSGIRGEDAPRAVSFGLKQGQTVDETGPDGSTRRVRVLPATF
ncbi:MAG: DUF2865 domain-containing protein [Hyphomicrobiales bacterium]|nr:DUF2865 domain-containing protein [Hyphomicrobiales bacterium]MBV8441297.1 DUF2865 domain-containing protein [Hyphomicrobiales bacterium]